MGKKTTQERHESGEEKLNSFLLIQIMGMQENFIQDGATQGG
jgi:hypothetical protein